MSSAVASARKPASTGKRRSPWCLQPRERTSVPRPVWAPALLALGNARFLYGLAWRVALSVDAIQLCSTAG